MPPLWSHRHRCPLYPVAVCCSASQKGSHIFPCISAAPNTSTDHLLFVLALKHSSLFSLCNFCPINLFLILVLLKHVESLTPVPITPANQPTLILQLTHKNIFLLLHFPSPFKQLYFYFSALPLHDRMFLVQKDIICFFFSVL